MNPSPKQKPHILVFDSGLGGLSIVREITQARIGAQITYLADTAYFPYGDKADAALMARVPSLIAAAATDCGADLVIIACNTASTLALDHTRRRVGVEVVGVVPAIKPAAALTKTATIGLLATPNTVARPYTDQLIADFAQNVRVIRYGATGLAACAEAMLSGEPLDEACIKASVDGLFAQDGGDAIDIVVLACTHYPHLKTQLASFAPASVTWIDSGAAIAQRARQCLALTEAGETHMCAAFTTGGNDSATRLGLLRWGFATAERLPSLVPMSGD